MTNSMNRGKGGIHIVSDKICGMLISSRIPPKSVETWK